MPEVTGIDHIYLGVRDLARSERYYDIVLGGILGFRKNRFTLEGDPHVQFYNRHFGVVLRPAAGGRRLRRRECAGTTPFLPAGGDG